MVCTVAAWGFNFVATRIALEIFSPLQMAFARSILTLVILLPWWKPFKPISIKLLAAAVSIGVVAYYLLYTAIGMTESLTAVAVGSQLFSPLSAFLALLLFQEHISPRKWLGILIATTGATLKLDISGRHKSPDSQAEFSCTLMDWAWCASTLVFH